MNRNFGLLSEIGFDLETWYLKIKIDSMEKLKVLMDLVLANGFRLPS